MRGTAARTSRARINPRQFLPGIAVLFILAAALVVVIQVSIAGVFRDNQPRIALGWNPADARARAQLAARLLTSVNPPVEARSAAAQLARESLSRDPLQPLALRSLALASARSRDESAARRVARLMLETHRISRRDQLTQLWLIDYARRRDDVPAMIRHFDIALRTSSGNRATLFQLLVAVSSDPRVSQRVAAMLRQKPQWALPFIAYLVDSPQDPAHMVRLAIPILDASVPVERRLIHSLLQRLTSARRYDLAWNVYQATVVRKGAGEDGTVRNRNFERMDEFQPFDWAIAQEENLWASRERRPGRTAGHVLRLAATSGGAGDAARQLLRLPPGRYTVGAEAGNVAEAIDARPELRVSCVMSATGAPLLAVKPAGSGPSVRFGGELTVPAGCEFQWIALQIAAGDHSEAISPWIDNVSIAGAGPRR